MTTHTAMQFDIGINPLYPGEKLLRGDGRWGEHTASFHRETHTIESLARRIAGDGCAFSAVMQDNYRKTANFISAQHIGLDDDRGTQESSLESLAADPFIAAHAAFIYESPSSTPEHPKSRIVFLLDEPYGDASEYRTAQEALWQLFEATDEHVKEPARFFYGRQNARCLVLGNILYRDVLQEQVIEPYLASLEATTNGHRIAKPIGETITEHNRNNTLTSLAGSMRRQGMTEEAIFAALCVENLQKCDPPVEEGEVRGIAHSVSRYEPVAADEDVMGSDQTPQEWEPPQSFDSVEVPAFPVDALPVALAEYVRQEATAKQTPVDLPGCLVLGALSAAAGGKCSIALAPDWNEPLNEYLAITLPSGERKSPEFRSVFKPLEEVEQERVKEKAAEILKIQTERDILEKRWQNAKTEAAKAKTPEGRTSAEVDAREFADELAKFIVPSTPRLLADDATPEAVAGLLAEQGGQLAITSTEGGIFEIIGGRYSESTPNLDVYLKAYSGDTIRVDRRSRPPEFVVNPCLTVVLTVPPDVITDLAERKAFRARGFLARWLYSLPHSYVGYRDINPPPVDPEVAAAWGTAVRRILELPNPDPSNIPLLHLSQEARDIFQSFRASVETNLRPGGELDDLADWGNKLAGHVARMAGVLHLAKVSTNIVDTVYKMYAPLFFENPIEPETMRAAVSLGTYFEAHAKAAFALMGSDARMAVAKKVWDSIVRHKLDSFKVSELWQKVRRSFSNVAELEKALATLEELGYIRALPVSERKGPGKPPSPMFLVNPLPRTLCRQYPLNRDVSGPNPTEDSEVIADVLEF